MLTALVLTLSRQCDGAADDYWNAGFYMARFH
jgi:hypothetical protein